MIPPGLMRRNTGGLANKAFYVKSFEETIAYWLKNYKLI